MLNCVNAPVNEQAGLVVAEEKIERDSCECKYASLKLVTLKNSHGNKKISQ